MKEACRLYKRALYSVQDWITDRHLYRRYARAIRSAFERRGGEKDPERVRENLRITRELLDYWRHDSPIVYPLSEGGTMEGREPNFSQEALEFGHRKAFGENWQEEMQKYEESLLYDKRQTYYNTPIVKEKEKNENSDQQTTSDKNKENQ